MSPLYVGDLRPGWSAGIACSRSGWMSTNTGTVRPSESVRVSSRYCSRDVGPGDEVAAALVDVRHRGGPSRTQLPIDADRDIHRNAAFCVAGSISRLTLGSTTETGFVSPVARSNAVVVIGATAG